MTGQITCPVGPAKTAATSLPIAGAALAVADVNLGAFQPRRRTAGGFGHRLHACCARKDVAQKRRATRAAAPRLGAALADKMKLEKAVLIPEEPGLLRQGDATTGDMPERAAAKSRSRSNSSRRWG